MENHQSNCPLSPFYQGGWAASIPRYCTCGTNGHSKAPEIECICKENLMAKECPMHYPEAPTDEDWTKDFTACAHNGRIGLLTVLKLTASLLQKEKEKAFDAGGKTVGGTGRTMYEAGKSEAFSLVRKIATEMRVANCTDIDCRAKSCAGGKYHNAALTDLLSTLEGK